MSDQTIIKKTTKIRTTSQIKEETLIKVQIILKLTEPLDVENVNVSKITKQIVQTI